MPSEETGTQRMLSGDFKIKFLLVTIKAEYLVILPASHDNLEKGKSTDHRKTESKMQSKNSNIHHLSPIFFSF